MKNITLATLISTFFISIDLFACSFIPYSFCETNAINSGDNVITGKITSIDTNGIYLEVFTVLSGTETRDTIRIWDGTDLECNGTWSMAASGLGALNDTIIVILPIIGTLQNTWDVIGDYRMPDNTIYSPKLFLTNDIVSGYIAGDPYFGLFEMPYNDFVNHWNTNMGNCIGLSIDESNYNSIISYTNPINNLFKLEIQNDLHPEKTIEVYSYSGKKMITSTFFSNKIEIDFSSLPSGVYFVRIISTEEKQSVIKVVKE